MKLKALDTLEEQIGMLYGRINYLRRLIGMHSLIANQTNNLIEQNFWGYLQEIIIRGVIIELFNILDYRPRKNGITIKYILNKLENKDSQEEIDKKIKDWWNTIKKYEVLRNRAIGHFDTVNPAGEKVDYEEVSILIDDVEDTLFKFTQISKIEDFENWDPCLQDLKQLLEKVAVKKVKNALLESS